MALDNLTLGIITAELQKQLVGSSFGKPLALSAFDYGYPFSCRESDGSIRHGTFVFSLDPSNPFVTYSHDRYEKVDDSTPFFNSLKKLSLSTVTKVTKLSGERIITVSLASNPNDLSEINTGYDLILELFPNHPNCYLIAYPYGKIVSLFRERTNIEKGILVARNTEYRYPPERPCLPTDLKTAEEARGYLSNACYHELRDYVSSGKAGLPDALHALVSSRQLYLLGKEILPYDFGKKEAQPIQVSEIYGCFVEDQKKLAKLEKEKELISLIEKAVKVSEKKLVNLNKDLENAKDHLVYLEYGQEIYLYQNEVKKGDKVLAKDGYTIPLDPLFDGPNNANRYFRKYTKAKAATAVLSDLIHKTQDEIQYLQKKLFEAKDGTPRDILELKSELLSGGYIKEKQGQRRIPTVSRKHSYDPHYLNLPDGSRIGFGMNGLQNENLTFKVAKKDDLFLHVKDYPGAHVVILEGAGKEEVRLLAGELALYLSHLDNGTVMIAARKDVKKNPDCIGLVNILRYETAVIRGLRPESVALFRKALKE